MDVLQPSNRSNRKVAVESSAVVDTVIVSPADVPEEITELRNHSALWSVSSAVRTGDL